MQDAIPLIRVVWSNTWLEIKIIEDIIKTKHNNCFIANDNSPQQIVVSGLKNIDLFSDDLNKSKIKNIKLNVSAPFHCNLMKSATENMREQINNLDIKELKIQ